MKVLLTAALAFLSFAACTDDAPTRAQHMGRDASSPVSDGPACEPQSRDLSYGKTVPGRWLQDVLVSFGAPGDHPLRQKEIRDTGAALWIDIPEYEDAIYAIMLTPDFDPNVTRSKTEKEVGRQHSYTLYFDDSNFAWESYRVANNKWQLALLAYPGAGKDGVTWPQGTTRWLKAAVGRAQQSPPRCGGPVP
ncbi:MAG: hypothetical protein ACR2LG_01405 [Actinomycetota bacterium]